MSRYSEPIEGGSMDVGFEDSKRVLAWIRTRGIGFKDANHSRTALQESGALRNRFVLWVGIRIT